MTSLPASSILSHVDVAIQELGRLEGLDADHAETVRSNARRSLARALSSLLQSADDENTTRLRTIVDGLIRVIDVRLDLHQLADFRDQLQALHLLLVQRTEGASTEVVRLGNPQFTVDFDRVFATSPTTTCGLLGTFMETGPVASVASGVLSGACSVARTGMGRNLQAAPLLTILDHSLKDCLARSVPVAMVAWQYDQELRKLRVASAGHRALWRIRNGAFHTIRTAPHDTLGLATTRCPQVELDAEPGDLIVGFTQGVLQQENARGELLRERDVRMAALSRDTRAVAAGTHDFRPAEVAHAIQSCLRSHTQDWTIAATVVVTAL
ncbi:MAG: SpoIIE family protein phosphatase [Myxococcota bacterium]